MPLTAARARAAFAQVLGAILWICAGPFALAQFAPDDEVRLRRDEPLHFKDNVFRQGKAGETFTVVRYDAAGGRVFLLARGSDGKPFALHCADAALEPMPKDYWALLHEGVRTMQQGDIAGARAFFVKAATANQPDKTAFGLALHCESLSRASGELDAARSAALASGAEAARLLRNAQVADRPGLIPGDDSNQLRAAEMRSRAAAISEQTKGRTTAAVQGLRDAIAAADKFASGLIESGLPSVGLPALDATDRFAAKVMPADQRPAAPRKIDRGALNQRINTATDAVVKARAAMERGQLRAAREAIDRGLQAEPARGELTRLAGEVEGRLSRVQALVSLANSLKEQQRIAEALAEVEKAEAICADDGQLSALRRSLRKAPDAQ